MRLPLTYLQLAFIKLLFLYFLSSGNLFNLCDWVNWSRHLCQSDPMEVQKESQLRGIF